MLLQLLDSRREMSVGGLCSTAEYEGEMFAATVFTAADGAFLSRGGRLMVTVVKMVMVNMVIGDWFLVVGYW